MLDDGEPGYGALLAAGFATGAERLGLRIAGRARWDPRARDYRALARRVAASGAEAVFVGGLLDTNAARVVRDLRAALGPDADIMGPDGLTPLDLLAEQAGAAARRRAGEPRRRAHERAPARGRRVRAALRRDAAGPAGRAVRASTPPRPPRSCSTRWRRSDGTRASLLDALFATRVRDGLLGDFALRAHAATSRRARSPCSASPTAATGPVEGGTVERVVRPPARLVE